MPDGKATTSVADVPMMAAPVATMQPAGPADPLPYAPRAARTARPTEACVALRCSVEAVVPVR